MIGIVDYGVGNLFSLESSFAFIGEKAVVLRDKDKLQTADKLILPGVGAFADAARKLRDSGMDSIILEEVGKGKPLLGICLGMQLLFEKSYEYGEHEGLGLIKGSIKPMEPVIGADLKVPHIGWNVLDFPKDKPKSRLFKHVTKGEHVYFVHSYYGTDCKENVIAMTEYGTDITAAVAKENIYGTQFHPEKSGDVGMRILKAFCEE